MRLTRRLAVAAALAFAALSGAAKAAEADMSLGDPKAPVTVIEYASVTCGHCAHWQEEVFPAFKAKYVDTGLVRYVLRELPTPPFDVAIAGFMAARCAGPERYFSVVDTLMRTQITLNSRNGAVRWLLDGSGLPPAELRACIVDQAGIDALQARARANAAEFGVQGTPTFVVNGRKLDGVPALADLDAAIQPLLPKAKKAKAK